jgi:hypothetical protein
LKGKGREQKTVSGMGGDFSCNVMRVRLTVGLKGVGLIWFGSLVLAVKPKLNRTDKIL